MELEPDTASAWTEFMRIYPPRYGDLGLKDGPAAFAKALASGVDLETILDGARRFRRYSEVQGTIGTQYIPKVTTWLNDNRWTKPYLPETPPRPQPRPPTMAEQLAALNELDRQPSEISSIIEEFRKALPDGNDFKLP